MEYGDTEVELYCLLVNIYLFFLFIMVRIIQRIVKTPVIFLWPIGGISYSFLSQKLLGTVRDFFNFH